MSAAMEGNFLTPATATLYLSQIELKNFGWFRNGSFKFSQRMNLIEGDNESGKMTLLKALEILLLPTKGGTVSLDAVVAESGMLAKNLGCPSVITGYFKELHDNGDSSGVEHSLRVTISKAEGKAVVKFHWDGSPRAVSKMRDILAKYGFHQTSVFFLSDETITMENLGPMKFLRRKLDDIPLLLTVKRNHKAIESLRKGLLEKIELYNLTSTACHRMKERMENILDPNFRVSDLELWKAELEKCARYSELKNLQENARLTERDIEKYEIRLERAKKKLGMTETRKGADNKEMVSSSVPGRIGVDDSTRRKLGNMLDYLRRELEKDPSKIENLFVVGDSSINSQSSLGEKLGRDQQEFLRLNTVLLKSKLAKRSVEVRLNLLNNNGETTNDEWRKKVLERKIEFLQSLRAANRSEKRELQRKLTELSERLREASSQKDELVEKAADEEKKLKICCDSEIIEEFAIQELKDLISSGNRDEELITAPSVAYPTQLLPEIFSVLELLGAHDEFELASFGFFGFIQDHIEVDSEFRVLMHRLQGFLGTLLVRNFDVACNLWRAMKELKFEDTVNVVCVNEYEAPQESFQTPDGTDHISTYVKIRERGRVVIDESTRCGLEKIIACELRHYFVIRGDRADAPAMAERLLQDPRWEVCKFLAKDGSYFSQEEWRGPPDAEDPITAYEAFSEYWYSVRSQIAQRARELERLRTAKEDHRGEHNQLMNLIGIADRNIANIHVEMNASKSLLNLLTDTTLEIESEIEELQERLVKVGGDHGLDRTRSLRKELEDDFRSLDSNFEVAERERRELDDSISKSIEAMTAILIEPPTEDANPADSKISQSPAPTSESDIRRIEELMDRLSCEYGNGEDERVEDEARLPSDQEGVAKLSQNESDVIELQTTLFLLKRKLGSSRDRIAALGNIQRPSNWDPKRSYAEELERLKERTGTKSRPAIDDASRRKLADLAKSAPKIYSVTREAVEGFERLLDISREKALRPKLEEEVLKSMVERFMKNFSELAPRGELRVVRDTESQSSSEGPRRMRKRPRLDDVDSESTVTGGEVVEVSFNAKTHKPRLPKQLSGGEGTVLGLSVLLSQAALSPARFLLLDEVDAPLDYSAQARFANFVNNFEPGCQIFVLSQKALEGSLLADERVVVNKSA